MIPDKTAPDTLLNEIENKALGFIADTYAPADKLAESDEQLTTAQLLTKLYQTFGECCTSFANVVAFMRAEGYTMTHFDSHTPRWLVKNK